jgi:polysaccharide export outer membrane protein
MPEAKGVLRELVRLSKNLTISTLIVIISAAATTAQLSSVEKRSRPEINRVYSEAAYTLGPGDRIKVEIFKLPQYSGEYEVGIDGSLNLSRIGSVSVRGMTLKQAAETIASRYTTARILRQPQVTVSLLAPRPLRIGIAGEINRPGSYTMPIQNSQFPTLTQALQLAGGITQAADLRSVKVSRGERGSAKQSLEVNLWQVIQTGDLNNDLILRDGDTILIPTATAINPAETPQLAAASFAVDKTQPIDIAVLGEVRKPGTHTIKNEGTVTGLPRVTQALEAAGGINPLADIRKIVIKRSTKIGLEQTIEIDLWQYLQTGDLQQDLILQNGDTVYVPTTTDINLAEASQLRNASFAPDRSQPLNITVIGEVFRPGPYTVTGSARTGEAGVPGGTGGSETPPTVTRAIQIAGGIKPLANIRNIEIRRFTSTGEERTLQVDLWKLLQAGDSSQDAVLQDGDTIVVAKATEPAPEEAAQIAAASFSPDTIDVNIVGEVPKPGIVKIPPNTPLNQALFAAGGFTNRAKKSSVQLVRLNPNGTVVRRKVEIDFAEGANEETNPVLYNNDVVIVGRSTLASVSDTLDTALNPLGKFLTIFSLPFNLINLFQ